MKSEEELYQLLCKVVKQFEDTDWNEAGGTVIELQDLWKERLNQLKEEELCHSKKEPVEK